MKQITFKIITLFILTSIFSIAADDQNKKNLVVTFDLQGVITRTLAENTTIKAARQSVTTAEKKVDEARSAQNVKVQGEAGYMQLSEAPSFTVAPMGSLVFGKTENPWANVSMDWPIYTGGMIKNMIIASRKGVDASWQGYERTKQEIIAEAVTAYFQVQSAKRINDVMQKQALTLLEAVRISTGLYEQGIVAKLDVLRPTSELASAQAGLIQAENGYHQALNNLKRIMNYPYDADIAVTTEKSNILSAPAELSVAIKTAMELRPEVKQLHAYMQATDSQKNIISAGKKPQIGVHAQYDIKRTSLNPEFGNWSIAFMLRQSLSDGGLNKAQLAEVKSQREELNIREQTLKQGIQMQISNAILSIQSAEKKVQAMTQAKNAATEGYRVAEASYKNQILPIIDVMSAQTALTNANMQYELAEFDQQIAYIQYHLALGDLPALTK